MSARRALGELFFLIRPKKRPRFSFVVACYNVEPYIDDFMKSLEAQAGGLGGVEVVFVNDGSRDDTLSKIRAWERKRLAKVQVIDQVNQGVAAARNAGLERATGDWVSFPDPDDFLSNYYLEQVTEAIWRGRKKITMVSCNFIRFIESEERYVDNHLLSFRFRSGHRIRWADTTEDMGGCIQLSASTAFFRLDEIRANDLRFDTRVIPTFEDGHFVNRYLARSPGRTAAFLREARYYYRQRSSSNSLMNLASDMKENWLVKPRFGWLDLLKDVHATRGYVPKFVQRTILYDLAGQLRKLLKRPQDVPFSDVERAEYIDLIMEIFRYIDADVIADFHLGPFYEDTRVGAMKFFKGQTKRRHRVNVIARDTPRRWLKLRYFSADKSSKCRVLSESGPIEKMFEKTVVHRWLGLDFVYEHSFWVDVEAPVKIELGEDDVEIITGRKRVSGWLKFDDAIAEIDSLKRAQAPEVAKGIMRDLKGRDCSAYRKALVIMDRPSGAGDNGEDLYRFAMNSDLGLNLFFVLSRDSEDWPRLERDGFRLVDYRSFEHFQVLSHARVLASSHGDAFVRQPFGMNGVADQDTYKFVFLQHGVTKDDQSEWFNAMRPSLLICATGAEYQSVVEPTSPYLLSEKEVKLTGFPRHDALRALERERTSLFVMPSWRRGVATKLANAESDTIRELAKDLEYFREWTALLASAELKALLEKHRVDLRFCPHPNFVEAWAEIDLPEHVAVVNSTQGRNIQAELAKAAMFLTDYSSVAFDAAYLDVPMAFFQFDQDAMASEHTYRPGYFSYERDGFGPVCESGSEVIDAVARVLEHGVESRYEKAMSETFPFRDGQCAKRVLDAILAEDERLLGGSARPSME